jgi:hypothetical protein
VPQLAAGLFPFALLRVASSAEEATAGAGVWGVGAEGAGAEIVACFRVLAVGT